MGVLNFSTDKLITGANIIEGNLYWTDDNTEPKKIDIERWKQDDIGLIGDITHIDGEVIDHSDITVIRPHPWKAIKLELQSYDDYADELVESGGGDPRDTLPEPPFESIYPRYSYRWRYEDGQYSPYAPFTQAAFIPKERVLESTGVRGVQEGDLDDDTNVARTDFFVPSTAETNYLEGYNTTMFNNVGKITLNNIPRGTRDVVAVDLLYTESISGTIYILETIEIPEMQRGMDHVISSNYQLGVVERGNYDLVPLRYEITTRKIYRALPQEQLIRDFDNVPRLAKAQEVTANRLIYGNYLHQYDQLSSVSLVVNGIEAESFPYLYPNRYPGTYNHTDDQVNKPTRQHLLARSFSDGLHVKGNRTYEIGVAYLDSYGRLGGMLQAGSITSDTGEVTEAGAFRMPFRQFYRQKLVAQITSLPPKWADKYRFYIKDVSMDHHNLVSYNIYNDGQSGENKSSYVWLEFQSTDRNKITEETILVPRRVNGDLRDTKTRHLVQDIQGEAPELIRNQLGVSSNAEGRKLSPVLSHYRAELQDAFGKRTKDYQHGNYPPNGPQLFIRDEREDFNETGMIQILNRYIADSGYEIKENGVTVDRFDIARGVTGTKADQIADTSGDGEGSLYVRVASDSGGAPVTNWARVEEIRMGTDSDRPTSHRTQMAFVLGENVMIEGTEGDDGIVTDPGVVALDPQPNTPLTFLPGRVTNGRFQIEFASSAISEEALERLQGRFWVKVPRNELATSRSEFDNTGELVSLNQVWFETEPVVAESNLDLFWESSQTFCVCTDHGYPNKLDWGNCIAEILSPKDKSDEEIEAEVVDGTPNWGPYLESTRINDRFNTVQLVRGVRANTPVERYAEERRGQGLIWSGIFNSRSGVNRLNQFIQAEGIQKELEPNYGTLQKLHTRDTNIIAFTEDKVFRILADKDQLYNADGGGNVSASNAVLGQTTPFTGEYGISLNPESFASYGHNLYFTDSNRGAVLQCTPSNGQIFEISGAGMNDVFRDRLFSADRIWGMFDNYTDKYILSVQDYDFEDEVIDLNSQFGDDGNLTFGYELDVEGWSSRFSYIPESGLSLNNKFYTFKDGKMWLHNSNTADRNNFYGEQYNSHVDVVFNDGPSQIKEFLTIGYEGTKGWELEIFDTYNPNNYRDLDIVEFTEKENKFFAPILQEENIYEVTTDALFDETADDGVTNLIIPDTRSVSGIKGFFASARLKNDSTEMAELFAINTESFISSN